ncbi:DUF4143 domain-containing protein, partial [Candidatus Bathyarchaeota archaeon]|nr:DUF4143 domain-containing protein [Candidatus Bathyarchaeota archaeon]
INEIIKETLENEELLSKIVESVTSSHLLMSFEIPYLKEASTFLWFYYDSKGRELDFVVRKNDGYLGIEVKYQNDVSPRDIVRVPEIDTYIILSKEDYIETENTLVAPAELFLSLLEKSKSTL